jgi:perosamine synthetase
MIPLEKVIITDEMVRAAANALTSEDLMFGESVYNFEDEFARFCGCDYAVSMGSGTDALLFALIAIGVKGKEALTTPASFVATANVAALAGGKPVFADIGADNNISPIEAAKAVGRSKKIKAMIPVHLHGYPAMMDELAELAEKKDIHIIEDACQAHGAFYKGERAGSIGEVGCFSFNPVKNMTVGGAGGMAVTNDEKLAKKIRCLADCGRESIYSNVHPVIGYSSRINTINAAIGRVQLRHLDGWNESRRNAAKTYYKKLEGMDLEVPLGETEDITPVFHKFAIKVGNRDAVMGGLRNAGIDCDAHYPIPIHFQPPYGYKKGSFPNAERFADTTLSLPMFPGISEKEIEEVVSSLQCCLQGNQGSSKRP